MGGRRRSEGTAKFDPKADYLSLELKDGESDLDAPDVVPAVSRREEAPATRQARWHVNHGSR